MKVSLNEIRRLGYDELVSLPIDELVEKIGAQLGAVEEVEDLGAKYKGVLVAKVVSCDDHPNADRLHICRIDDGGVATGLERDENGHVQVICGAPNVREGLLVAWLPPGSTVPETYHHEAPFVLDARELRGIISNGMLASPKELALSDAHEGILEIDTDARPGQAFAEVYQLDDHIIDIENKMFTHRPDCFGLLGVARELAGIQHKKFTSPEWYSNESQIPTGSGLELSVENEVSDIAARFVAVALKNITVGPSPLWLQTALIRLGSRPINNVVDVTNYAMLITGQPLHAYDYDKVASHKLGVRMAHDGEKLSLLNGKEVSLSTSDIVIADGEKAIGLGGVMGGADTEVDAATTNIILECANFDMYAIRRTSMRHGLFTDAVTRFNKGQSPLQNDKVVAYALTILQDITGAETASKIIDDASRVADPAPVKASNQFINQRLGLELSAEEMARLLMNVEFSVTVEDNELTIQPPFWRTDIEIAEDIVEEVGRLYGYDRLPLILPKRSITPATRNPMQELKSRIRKILSRAGANEVLTYSFVHGNLLQKVNQSPEDSFQLTNALSPDLQYYRQTVLPSLLDKVHANIKAGYDEVALFEIGKGHNLSHADDDEGLPSEFELLDFVYAASDKVAGTGAAYYHAQRYLRELLSGLGVELEFRAIEHEANVPVVKPFDLQRSAFVFARGTDEMLGMVGELKPGIRKAMKLPVHTAAFTLGLADILNVTREAKNDYHPLSRYPGTAQDICFRVAETVSFADLDNCIRNVLVTEVVETRCEPIDIYQAEDSSDKQITFRIHMTNYEKTMTGDEANQIVKRVVDAAVRQYNATVI